MYLKLVEISGGTVLSSSYLLNGIQNGMATVLILNAYGL